MCDRGFRHRALEAGVPDYEVTTFNGIVAPANTPAAIRNRLNAAINVGLQTPEMRETIDKLGAVADITTADAFGSFVARQFQKWVEVGKAANVRID